MYPFCNVANVSNFPIVQMQFSFSPVTSCLPDRSCNADQTIEKQFNGLIWSPVCSM